MMFGRAPRDPPEEEEKTSPGISKPVVSVKKSTDAQGVVFYIRDAALEHIDSTRDPGRVEALVAYWQEELYGEGRGRGKETTRRVEKRDTMPSPAPPLAPKEWSEKLPW